MADGAVNPAAPDAGQVARIYEVIARLAGVEVKRAAGHSTRVRMARARERSVRSDPIRLESLREPLRLQEIELEDGCHVRLAERPVEEITLDRVTTLGPEKFQLSLGFHSLCDHFEFQTMCHDNDGPGDVLVAGITTKIPVRTD